MPIDLSQLFVQTPGDFVFFLLVLGLSQVALTLSFSQYRRVRDNQMMARYAGISLGVVLLWMLFLVSAIVTQATGESPMRVLPPLDRFILTMTTLLFLWGFIAPEVEATSGRMRLLLVGWTLFIGIMYGVTAFEWWQLAPMTDFNLTSLALSWLVLSLGLGWGGIALMALSFRAMTDAPLKLLFMVLIVTGASFSTYQTTTFGIVGNYDGTLRLAFLFALTLVPVIIYRAIMRQLDEHLEVERKKQVVSATVAIPKASDIMRQDVTAPPQRTVTDGHSSQLLRAMGLILEARDADEIPSSITKTTRDILRADVVALLRLQDANYADFTVIADSLNRLPQRGMSLNLDNQPTLVNAVERQALRVLYPDRNQDELMDFYTRMDVEKTGPVYFQPLVNKKEIVAVLVVANPYTESELTKTNIELLKGIGIISSNLLAISYVAQESRRLAEDRVIQAMVEGVMPDAIDDERALASRQVMEANLNEAQQEINDLNREVMRLKVALDEERNRIAGLLVDSAEDASISEKILAINEEQTSLRDERDALARRLQEAETALISVTTTDGDSLTQGEVERLVTEREALKRERDSLQAQLDDLFARDRSVVPEMQKVVYSMLTERERLMEDREQLRHKLNLLYEQLDALGVTTGEETGGLSQVVVRLTEERAKLQAQLEKVQHERQLLLQERAQLEEALQSEDIRNTRIEQLEKELKNLAADREAVTRQRDKLRGALNDVQDKLEQVKQHRARLLAQVSGMELELSEIHDDQTQLRAQIQDMANEQPAYRTPATPEQVEVMMSLVQDLRSPLTSIVGYLDLLMSESAGILGEMQRNFLQRVHINVDRLRQMLDDLIQISQLDSGQRHFHSTRIDLVRLLEDAITEQSIYFRAKEILLEMDLPEDLPTVHADKDAVLQIINQLLVNAYLVSPPASNITVIASEHEIERGAKRSSAVRVSISDSGGGIESDDLPRIFARKYKAEHPLVSGLGDTGVGMAIVKALVDAHQGELWVTTQAGKGSTFHFAIPVQSHLT